MKPKSLSKTRFKLALACQTKVFYNLDERYANQMQHGEVLEALACLLAGVLGEGK